MGAHERVCDVVILGAGMAGGCMARQLKLQMPDLDIIVLEKKKAFDYWIGESTVEVWADYACRVLGLAPYLWKNQIMKHGLRFFYDSEKKDLPFSELSENGLGLFLDLIPSYQLDRQKLDQDLVEMNRAMGIDVRMGVEFDGRPEDALELDREKGHLIRTAQETIRCKWLIDAAGRASPIARKLGVVEWDERHPAGSYWGRFKNTRIIDDLGPEDWRRRVNYTFRHFSTNHMMYKGYWFWLIPVTHDILSIGVQFQSEISPMKMRNAEDLVRFTQSHRWGRELLGDEFEVLDFMGFTECARRAKQYYSHDRWFLTGMSSLVVDALYSTTGVAAAYSNRLIGELIRTDRSGDDARFRRQLHHFNIWMRMRYEYFLRAIGNYEKQGSFEVMMGLRQTIQSIFHNQRVPESTEDLASVIRTADEHAAGCECSLEKSLKDMDRSLIASTRRLASELTAFLEQTGNYYTANRGQFRESTPRHALTRKYYVQPRNLDVERQEDLITYEAMFRHYLRTMASYSKVPWNDQAFDAWFKRDWNSGQTLAEGMTVLRRPSRKSRSNGHPHEEWSTKGPVEWVRVNSPDSTTLAPPSLGVAPSPNGRAPHRRVPSKAQTPTKTMRKRSN